MNNLPNNWKIPVLALCAIILSILPFLFKKPKVPKPPEIQKPALSFSIKPESGIFKTKDKILLKLFVLGGDVEKITAAEVKLNFDANAFKLSSAKAGDFFANPLEVLFDKENASFSLIENPVDNENLGKRANSQGSLVDFEFTVLKASQEIKISTDPLSIVFVSQKGAVNPKPTSGSYTIN